MTLFKHARNLTLTTVLAATFVLPGPALAGSDDSMTTPAEVRAEITEAMQAIRTYSQQERQQALTRARATLDRLDAEIERRQEALLSNWADMSEEARQDARAALRNMQQARNRLGERFGAMEAGTADAWDELKAGFADAYEALHNAWRNEDTNSGS